MVEVARAPSSGEVSAFTTALLLPPGQVNQWTPSRPVGFPESTRRRVGLEDGLSECVLGERC